MIDKLDYIINKLDTMQEDVTTLRIESAKNTDNIERNTKDLTTHIKRTNLLETSLNAQRDHCKQVHSPLPVSSVIRWVLSLGAVAGAIAAVLALLKLVL